MSKTAWLLPVAAAVAYAVWSVNQEPPPTPTSSLVTDSRFGQGDTGSAAVLGRVEQRLALLEQRLNALEARPQGADPVILESLADLRARFDDLEQDFAQQNGTRDLEAVSPAAKRAELIYAQDSESSATVAEDLRRAFEDDDIPEPALQVELENAQYLFDSPKIADLAFREMDCRARYCRLGYEDNSEDWSDAAITENELLLLLSEKYGDNITVHAGERDGSYRSLYIELDQQ